MNQFLKHTQDDKSLQRDRLVGRGPGGMQEGMRSQAMGGGGDGVSNALSECVSFTKLVIRIILILPDARLTLRS